MIEKAIKDYILFFGLEDQIISTFDIFKNKYKDTKLDFESLNKGSKELWRPSMRV